MRLVKLDNNLKEPLVSVITPCYNAEKYIAQTIESVLNQTYKNIELLIVDDISDDDTSKIVNKYQEIDNRVKFIKLSQKGGASGARNKALKIAKGKYVAFLDADDLWKPEKLKTQIAFMEKNDISFSYTDYEYMNESGVLLHKKRVCPKKVNYARMLIGDSIGCLTVVYNAEKVGKIKISSIKKRNDYALWCLALKKVRVGYKCNGVLSIYRKTNNSISSGSKFKLLKYHYQLHKNINKFNFILAGLLTIMNAIVFFANKIFREKTIKYTKKVGIIGHFATGKVLTDGQTVKTQNVCQELTRVYGKEELFTVDTYNWKKSPLSLLLNCIRALSRCDNIIILPAKNGIKVFVPLLVFLNKFYKKRLHYILIGSWLYELLLKNKHLIKKVSKFNAVYVENKVLMQQLKTLKLNNLYLMYNFKNITPIKPENIKPTDKNNIKLCIFSRIMYEKGIEDAITCVEKISKDYKNRKINLDIYGPIDSKYVENFQLIISKCSKNIRYCGIVPSGESVDTIKNYDILLFPTRFKTEGIPGTILDAYAAGVAVLASKWDNSTEIIENDKTGVLFEIFDEKDFYLKLKYLLENPQKINDLKRCALMKYQDYIPSEAVKILLNNIERMQ